MTQPVFSIIVPTYNRARQLAACLESLVRLDYPRNRFEVIVVDDESETSPQAVVARFRSRLELTLLTQPHAGPAGARNAGAAKARGRFLAFTDDDCAPAPDWLRTLEARFATAPDHAIGGPTINALPGNAYAVASQLVLDAMFAHYNSHRSQAHFLASNNLAVPADGFHAISGFDATFFPIAAAEDRDFCERWLQHGCGMIYAREVRVFHAHSLTLPSFCRQHFNRGRGAFWLRQARARRRWGALGTRRASHLKPFSMALRLLRQAHWRQAPLLATLLIMWRAANAAGFLWESLSLTVPRILRAQR